MTAVIDRSCNWIRNHFPTDKVNKASIIVILLYYYVGLLSYITCPWWNIHRFFISSNPVSMVVRVLMTALICLYSLLVVIVNKDNVQWKWLIIVIYILLFNLLSMAISPQTYSYVYVSSQYQIVHLVKASPGLKRLAVMYLTSVSDFALAFCLLFIFPIVINNKKQLFILLFPLVIIGLLECGYSIIIEKEEYIKVLEMAESEYGGYGVSIGATFGNKQDWGAFITICYSACFYCFYLFNRVVKKVFRYLMQAALIIISFVFLGFTFFSLCKTAIMSEIFVLVVVVVWFIIGSFKKSKVLFILLLGIIFLGFLGIASLYLIPSLRDISLISKLYTFIDSYIIKRIMGSTLSERTAIWLETVSHLRTFNLFFGLSKGAVATYSQVSLVEGQTGIHNGFAYYFLSYGVLAFAIYFIFLGIVIKRIVILFHFDCSLAFCSIGALICALVFTLVEAEVFIVSGSNPIFIFNVLLCAFTAGYVKKEVAKYEEK